MTSLSPGCDSDRSGVHRTPADAAERTLSHVSDLADRWRSARCAALRSVLACSQPDETELDLISRALDRDAEGALRAAFDNSYRLGNGFRNYYRLDLPVSDIMPLLPRMGVACLDGTWAWRDEPPHGRLERAGCARAALHRRACDFYREATQGLIHGLSTELRHARHQSLGHGGELCVDVLYVAPQSQVRFRAVPDEMRAPLADVARTIRLFDSSAEVVFVGLLESTLFYTVTRRDGCGDVRLEQAVERALKRRFDTLQAREISAQQVWSEPP